MFLDQKVNVFCFSLQILENEKANNFDSIPKEPDSIRLTNSASVTNSQEFKNIPVAEPHKTGCC